MLIIKVTKKNTNIERIKKYLLPCVLDHIKTLFRDNKVSVIDDSKNIEFTSSSLLKKDEDLSTIELTYKKIITINNSNINEKQYADKIISEIKNFCDHSLNIENYVYLPPTMRAQENADNGAGTNGNRSK